jgi:3-hydroxyacyl-[acyl-carrier-protein] dehydratase
MNERPIDIMGVLDLLPQRPPFLFVDKVLEFEYGKRLVAIKNVTINEPFFQGHFPQQPVFPGVLMIEALAQAAIVFAFLCQEKEDPNDAPYLFAGINKARFKRLVLPGDQLRLEVELIKRRNELWVIQGTAKVGDEIACTAELMSVREKKK